MKTIWALVWIIVWLGSFVRASDASFYKYVDKNGVVCVVDNLQVVPEQYRSKAVIVENEAYDDEKRPAGSTEVKRETVQAAPEAASEERKPTPLSSRLMISGAVGISAFVLFIILKNLPGLNENRRRLSFIRGSLIGLFSLYLVIAHLSDITVALGMAGHAVDEVQQQSAQKGKKAGQAIKSFDGLFEEAQKAQKAQKAQETSTEDPADCNK